MPDRAIAREPAVERDLPNAVAAADAALSLHVHRLQLKVLLQLINHGAAIGVDAKVLECQLEVRDVRFDLGVEELLGDEHCEEEQLLADG
jgi:hypothetical protein